MPVLRQRDRRRQPDHAAADHANVHVTCVDRHGGTLTGGTGADEGGRGGGKRGGEAAAREPTVLVLGHEQHGIPPEALDLLDEVVEIPMAGTGASLNVAVAGSLVLYRLAGLL
ncbi:TrmH family RNA methyltransferase [Streptomyces sp. NRRL S-1813]|uniref:TrmH family RNA methyltransferase n=1 Tax=Streptomyces sp. NRRL S-1813 TaxID=1463888 RepID=UPI002278DE05|nr:TrmH family RNA methyltransferase [Streptomyces sp. NRRL S-1813]